MFEINSPRVLVILKNIFQAYPCFAAVVSGFQNGVHKVIGYGAINPLKNNDIQSRSCLWINNFGWCGIFWWLCRRGNEWWWGKNVINDFVGPTMDLEEFLPIQVLAILQVEFNAYGIFYAGDGED